MKRILLTAMFLTLLCGAISLLDGAIPAGERQALIALYNSTGGDSWYHNTGWKAEPLAADGFALAGTEGTWYGVTVATNHVTKLSLRSNRLTGILPAEIGGLPRLQILDLGSNDLTGAIPPVIGDLTALQTLNFHSNDFTGPVPEGIGNLSRLEYLDLSLNELSGTLPTQLGHLSNLRDLRLSYNQFNGTIPSQIGNLANLEYLSLAANQLTGAIPSQIGNLSRIQFITLRENQLSGPIPAALGNLAGLKMLILSINQLSGAIPASLGNLASLSFLDISGNQLTGAIPDSIGNLANLVDLGLGGNQLTGAIPSSIFNLAKLEELNLSGNQIAGKLSSKVGNLTQLRYLALDHNQLSGAIPPQIGNLNNLDDLSLEHNRFSGPIPPQIGDLTGLTSLYLESNQLTGAIPVSMHNLHSLNNITYFEYCSGCTQIGNNGLYSNDAELTSFLNDKDEDWAANQTIAPANVLAATVDDSSIQLSWDAIPYIADTGGYRVFVATASGGPYTFYQQTADKTVTAMTVSGLLSGDRYYFVVRTRTEAHGDQLNTVDSEKSAEVSAATLPGAILVTSPAPGAQLQKGQSCPIAWSKVGTQNAEVRILLYKGTSLTLTISARTANDGAFDWTVPAALAKGSGYVIRVKTVDNLVKGDSGAFSIIVPSITVTAPAAGETWAMGTTRTVAWSRTGTQDANVRIQLLRDGLVKLGIAAAAENDGSFDWDIPTTLAKGQYAVKAITLDGKVKGTSKLFSIVTGVIRVTSPATGAQWFRGTAYDVAWTAEGVVNENVRIQLYKGTTLISTLSASMPTTVGTFSWTVPAAQAVGTNYAVKVTALDNKASARSGNFAVAADAGLALLAPNGDAPLRPNEPLAVRWTVDPDVLDVKLEFSRDNGGTFSTIADHVANTGRYDWLVPVRFTRNGIVRVSDASGRPWAGEGLLELAFRFRLAAQGDGPAFRLWFGNSKPKAPGCGFAAIDIGEREVGFGGLSMPIEPLAGGWHELKVRLDFRRDEAELRLDDRVLFANAALGTTREHHFEPALTLQAGREKDLDLALDDLAIDVVQLDEAGDEAQRFSVLRDDFERYDEANPMQSCWRGVNAADEKAGSWLDRETPGNKALRLRSAAGAPLLLLLPFSLPECVPFDISDRQLTVAP